MKIPFPRAGLGANINGLIAIGLLAGASVPAVVPTGALAAEHRLSTEAFAISEMGPEAFIPRKATDPDIVYNPDADEYFVVWRGSDDEGELHPDEYEIYSQRIDAESGAELGIDDARISDMGEDGDERFDAEGPRVAYASGNREYLVVWSGDDDRGFLIDGEFEVFGQRIDARTGEERGENDFRISDMASDRGTGEVAIAYNPRADEYLVVWTGEDTLPGSTVSTGLEIFGQRIHAATGTLVGPNDFRISFMDVPDFAFAQEPDVVFNRAEDEYLVIWNGQGAPAEDRESEIHGQRLEGSSGDAIGKGSLRLTDHGFPGWGMFYVREARVALDPRRNRYQLVYSGRNRDPAHTSGRIFGRLLDATATPIDPAEELLSSNQGVLGSVVHDGATDQVHALFVGSFTSMPPGPERGPEDEDDKPSLFVPRGQVATRSITAQGGQPVQVDDELLVAADEASGPRMASNPARGEHLAVWAQQQGDDFEIFGQRVSFGPAPTCLDIDGDGYGAPGDASCPAGAATDCEDDNPAVNPSAAEIPGNNIDDDCDRNTPGNGACAAITARAHRDRAPDTPPLALPLIIAALFAVRSHRGRAR